MQVIFGYCAKVNSGKGDCLRSSRVQGFRQQMGATMTPSLR